MQKSRMAIGVALSIFLIAGASVVLIRPDWLRPTLPVNQEEGGAETEVPVHVAKIESRTLRRAVDGYGTVTAEAAHDGLPAASAHLASPVSGVLVKSLCAEGQRVEEGATLFQLDPRAAAAEEQKASSAITSARATVEGAVSQLAYQERELERSQKLTAQGLASDKDLHDAELRRDTAKTDLLEARAKAVEAEQALAAATTGKALLAIKAPISGTVVHIFVNPGEAVDTNPANVIADLVDLTRLVITANIPASELPLLKPSEPVEIELRETPSASREGPRDQLKPIDATLSFVGLAVDEKTNTIPVRAKFGEGANLRPGQYVRLRIIVEERPHVLTVPRSAVTRDVNGHDVVAIVTGDRSAQKEVTLGIVDGNYIQISGDGITEGELVVTDGSYGLPKETKVKIVDSPASP